MYFSCNNTCAVLKEYFPLQVVEISSINEHLISECEQKDVYMKCKVCQMAILKSEQNHTGNEECQGEWNQGREGHPYKSTGHHCTPRIQDVN